MEDKDKLIAELKAENGRLIQQLAEIGKSWDEISQMRKEKEDWMLRCAEKDNDIEILVSENAKLQKIRELLQDIKAIAEELLEKGLEPQSVEHQLRLKGKRELASIILDLITKAESEV